ncbi:MAG TPA: SRPBCC family protein [Mycobacteriales bacterium]|nr:SRPBCC family protein [Mycobacteriales bacterium]
MQRVDITQDFRLPVSRIYEHLAEHENLAPLFGATVRRVRDGDSSRNGAGSVRALRVGPGPWFEETVTEAVPNERIAYRISRGSPLRDHQGVMTFTSTPDGSRLHYVIEFRSAVPGLAKVVQLGLARNLTRGLRTLDHLA